MDGSNKFSTSIYVIGKIYAANYTAPTPATLGTAISALEAAYTDANTRTAGSGAFLNPGTSGEIGGLTLAPGVYTFTGAENINVHISTVLTLNGGPTDVWIFQIPGTLNIATSQKVLLTGGALAANIFWAVADVTTLGVSSTFEGNILEAGSVIALQTSATLHGRALSKFAVTLDANTVSGLDVVAPQLTVTKVVINDNGGTVASTTFPLFIDGSPVTTEIASTTSIGAHTVSETYDSTAYTQIFSSNCPGGKISLVSGDEEICTITNDDIAPQLTVTKTVVNTGGGTKAAADFPLFIDDIGVPSGVASTTTIGAHMISETPNSNYTSLIGGDCTTNGTITLVAGAVKSCTITNTYIPPAPTSATLHIIKHVINDNGGSATATNFTIHVAGTNVSNFSFTGSEAGVDITLDAGSYSVTEPVVPTGYLESGSGGCSGTIAAGETKTCTITNDDVAPKLIVNKIVVNDNGGTKVIADFLLFIDGGSVTSGVASTTTVGAHTVSETSNSGYAATIGGNCAANGTITLALGDVKTCTITNDDIARPSSGGGSSYSYVSPVPPLIDVVKVPSPLILPTGPGSVTYTYTLRNIGTVPVTNITMVGDTCSPIVRVSGDTNGDNRLDVAETWVYTCSTTLAKTHTNIVTTIGWANGISATDIANATVIVGIPVVPPLIHVTKIPSSLTLPSGGAMIVYTNKVTNPGTVPLSNVRLTDDKCDPVKYISGDTNNDSKLDTTETWTYTCQTKLIKTTVNTVTASGEANGLTAKDFAIATVVVAPTVSKLPNTGVTPEDNSAFENIVLFFGLLMLVSISVVIVLKKRKT